MNTILKTKNILSIIVIILLILITSCSQSETSKMNQKFRKIKTGMTPAQVNEILGNPDESYTINQNYVCDYWFIGASSIDEAEKLRKKGVAVKYYGVIYYTEDLQNFTIISKDDIIKGTWGKE